jgi:hypothetical protein
MEEPIYIEEGPSHFRLVQFTCSFNPSDIMFPSPSLFSRVKTSQNQHELLDLPNPRKTTMMDVVGKQEGWSL